MQASRDDFVIAVRSAFLKKDNKQRFSLIGLLFVSMFFLFLETTEFLPIKVIRSITKDVIYRSSFLVSLPEKYLVSSYDSIKNHFNLYSNYKSLKNELIDYKSQDYEIEYLKAENKRLNQAIEGLNFSSVEDIAKVLLDKESPFLKSIIINKGSKQNIKKGMTVLDSEFLIGKVAEVNYLSSRVLLLSDLNSKIPITIEPGGAQAILSGTGIKNGKIEYSKKDFVFEEGSVAYTSGAGGLFKPGIPIGKIKKKENDETEIEFFVDFTQSRFVKVLEYIKENN